MLTLPAFLIQGPDDAVSTYYGAGLRPILIHAPLEGGGCSCGQKHSAAGKHPIAKSWQKETSLDELHNQIARLKFSPNVGLVLGEQQTGEYVVAIDVDDEDRMKVLEGELGALPETVRGESGRGYRLFFELGKAVRTSEVVNVTGLSTTPEKVPGVDVKVKGGQVVVAPSLHANGKRYTWSRVGLVAELPTSWALNLVRTVVPTWVRDYTPQTMREDARAKKRAERYLEKAVVSDAMMLAAAGPGARNTTLHRRAVALLSLCAGLYLGARWSYVIEELHRAARSAGLGEREVRSTLASAEKYVRESGQVRVPVSLAEPPASLPPPESAPAPAVEYAQTEDPLEYIKLIEDKGSPAKIAGNVAELLARHPAWCGGPMIDKYSQSEIWPWPLPEPIRKVHRADREIVDADHAEVQDWLMSLPNSHRVRVGRDEVFAGIHLSSSKHTVDLLRMWIESLPPWDGEKRIRSWVPTYLGCEDNQYTRSTGHAWMLALIERALVPGVVVDVIPILEGKQKNGKNHALTTLFKGGPGWAPWITSIAGHKLEKAESQRLACTRWVLHDDEFRSKGEKRVDELKSWASKDHETYRLQYKREITHSKRRALLVTSTNESTYLHDDTGNRRWWPWKTGRIDVVGLERDRLQLFAEAFFEMQTGVSWRDPINDEVYERGLQVAEDKRVVDPIVEQLSLVVSERIINGHTVGPPHPLTTHNLGVAIGYPVDRIDRSFEMKVGRAMRELGYTRQRVVLENGTRPWVYVLAQAGQHVPH